MRNIEDIIADLETEENYLKYLRMLAQEVEIPREGER